MVKVPGTKGPVAPSATSPAQPAAPVKGTPPGKTPMADDGLSQAARGLLGYKSSPLVSGAMKIFGDNVILPANLTDPKNPANDFKYLRLLSAVLGLDELERHFFTLEGEKQAEYLEHKAKLREARWEKIEREKEEKRQQREQEDSSEEES